MTTTITVTDFVSKECHNDKHQNCYGVWVGLGLEVICCCRCGHNKKDQALESVEGPVANAMVSSFQENAQNDYT